ncbi:Protein MANNAN SYNTHESIS-RELATED 2 [Linum grandiflorum]
MGVDLRQVVAGILTITMFVMLGDMLKRDYVDTPQERFPSGGEGRDVEFDSGRMMEKFSMKSNGPWMEESQELKPCWTKKSEYGKDEIEDIKGFVTFSLTNGPEYHVSQISDAVTIARYLKATLVVPDIRGDRPGDERKFEEIYDVRKFVNSLEGVVKVARELPESVSIRDFEVVRVPNRVTEEHIAENIEPVFKRKGNIRIATYFPSVNMRKTIQKSGSDSLACLAMFDTLELKAEVNEVVDDMVARLKTLSRKSEGRFVAVDLRVDMLEKKGCEGGSSATKNCYNGHEIALFLRKIGFGQETVVYLTQSRWDESLEVLKDIFPKTYTKESVMSAEKKPKFLEAEDSELEKVIDFYLCTRSDVFVPAISGLFYANVAGKRIAAGKTQILVPAEIPGTSSAVTSHFSPYISKRNHMAYTCFC